MLNLKYSCRYIISLAVADWSGQAWLQGFNDVGVAVFGMPANDLLEIKVCSECSTDHTGWFICFLDTGT